MKRAIALIILGLSIASPMPLSHADDFDNANQSSDDAFAEIDNMWDDASKDIDNSWQTYSDEIDQAWNRYAAEIDAAWGKENSKTPSKKEWVEYSEKRDARSSIDFEKGELQVDIILEPGELPESMQVKERIQKRLELVITEPAREDPALKVTPPFDLDITDTATADIHPLKGQLKLSNGETVTQKSASKFAKEVIKSQPIKSKIIQTPKGKKQVVSVSVALIADHVKKRAMPYLKRVKEMAQRYNIPPSLIFGIMQTESYFNPMSRSHVPAYGLMQLVPRSGGLDAYEYVFKEKKILSADYLYNAENNIELGSAYLKLLQVREMRRIKDAKTRMLCAIAAYNTGGGNVAKAFIPGSRSIKKASAIINTMTYEQVYEHLRAHLPYEETQRYVMKVRKHMKNFARLDS
ncbi:DUF3393 domain-containing protein [Mariprofundus sp. EBB-1]|nr:DUF3393 domain-containing protein [Mariprofundus sp. EBB-1]